MKSCLALASLALTVGLSSAQDPVVTLPGLGTLQGRVKSTVGNLGNTPKQFYNFRNIPFANSVSGDKRFSVKLLFALTADIVP